MMETPISNSNAPDTTPFSTRLTALDQLFLSSAPQSLDFSASGNTQEPNLRSASLENQSTIAYLQGIFQLNRELPDAVDPLSDFGRRILHLNEALSERIAHVRAYIHAEYNHQLNRPSTMTGRSLCFSFPAYAYSAAAERPIPWAVLPHPTTSSSLQRQPSHRSLNQQAKGPPTTKARAALSQLLLSIWRACIRLADPIQHQRRHARDALSYSQHSTREYSIGANSAL